MTPVQHIQKLIDENNFKALHELAATQGLKIHHNMKNCQKIGQAILDAVQTQSAPVLKHPAELPQPEPMKTNSEEEIRSVCKQFFDKPGFEALFRDDDTWCFRYKGAEDSGHMSVPLRIIRMKAGTVAQGALQPRMMKAEDGSLIFAA